MKKLHLIKLLIVAIAMTGLFSACKSSKTAPASYSVGGSNSVVLSYDPSGIVDIKAWGNGATRADAVDAAVKRAVTDIVFEGFYTGPGLASGQRLYPLVAEPNARERYDWYFSKFLARGGEYTKYAKENRNNEQARSEANGDGRFGVGTVVTVDRGALRDRLIKDGIIKP